MLLPEFGFRLVFENSSQQELMLIEVVDFEFIKLYYNGFNLNDITYSHEEEEQGEEEEEVLVVTEVELQETALDVKDVIDNLIDGATDPDLLLDGGLRKLNLGKPIAVLPTLHQIYNKVFGPTYPGKLVLSKQLYVISYPGISFRFKINLDVLIQKLPSLNENGVLSELLNWDKHDNIVCESLAIFNGDSWDSFFAGFKESLMDRSGSKAGFKNSKLITKINKFLVNLSNGTVECVKDLIPYRIVLGETTQQEILNILGPPDDYFNKFDSRLLIHKHLNDVNKSSANCQGSVGGLDKQNGTPAGDSANSILKFHNYFRFGLDFLYNLNPEGQLKTGVLQKIIIHNGGIVESLDFMRWNKCNNWEIHTVGPGKQDNVTVQSLMYFNEIPKGFFNQLNKDDIRPVLLNRNEAEFIDSELDIINLDELPRSKSLNISNRSPKKDDIESKVKTWGQSMLYGSKNCIWEVIESNGCISCVTIY